MEDSDVVRVFTLDEWSPEYKGLERKFLDSVKNGVYNTGRAPNMNHTSNPVGQFNQVNVCKVKQL